MEDNLIDLPLMQIREAPYVLGCVWSPNNFLEGGPEETNPCFLWSSDQIFPWLGMFSCVPTCRNALCTQSYQNRCELTHVDFRVHGKLWQKQGGPTVMLLGGSWEVKGSCPQLGLAHLWACIWACWVVASICGACICRLPLASTVLLGLRWLLPAAGACATSGPHHSA